MPAVPDAFVERYAPVLGGEEALREELDATVRPAVRANALRVPDPEGLVEDLRERGIVEDPVPWWPRAGFVAPGTRVGNLPEHSVGRLYGMDAASILPALALAPEPGDHVLEVAAAPGSKAGLVAELMGGEGLLVANDVNEGRAYNLVANLQRLGVLNACVTVHDGRAYPSDPLDRGVDGFDRVLVDTPCTNLGKAPYDGVPHRWSPDRAEGLAGLQRGLVRRAARLVRPGGVLVYSTCTFDPVENEGVVDWLLEREPVAVADPGLDVEGADPVTAFDGEAYDPSVEACLRLHPSAHGTEAFFVARLEKDPDAGVGAPDGVGGDVGGGEAGGGEVGSGEAGRPEPDPGPGPDPGPHGPGGGAP